MIVVLDTNVLVAGLLSPFGPPASILRLVASGDLCVCHNAATLSEYEAVLRRPRFQFSPQAVEDLLEYIRNYGISVTAQPLPAPLPDPDDEVFLEVARSGGAECLVTGNLRHFPKELRCGVRVVSPREFIEFFRSTV